jgi:hypothetical protein
MDVGKAATIDTGDKIGKPRPTVRLRNPLSGRAALFKLDERPYFVAFTRPFN